jgi:hypothetical protein
MHIPPAGMESGQQPKKGVAREMHGDELAKAAASEAIQCIADMVADRQELHEDPYGNKHYSISLVKRSSIPTPYSCKPSDNCLTG